MSAPRGCLRDVLLVIGFLVCLVAFLFFISSGGPLYRWLRADGYRTVEVVVDPPAPPPFSSRTLTVHIVGTGERLYIPTSAFEIPVRPGRRRVWFNPNAQLSLGFRIFDERVVTKTDPRSATAGVLPALMTIALAVIGVALMRVGWRER